jgi:heavy metal translocating P-type ATPase
MKWTSIFKSPYREYGIAALVAFALALNFFFSQTGWFLVAVAVLGSLPTVWGAWGSIKRFRINIDTFNILALGISFLTREFNSAAFIVLMLDFASLLDWRTESRAHDAVRALLQLKPPHAAREQGGEVKEISVEEIRTDDVLIVKEGARVPADGVITFGTGLLNESSVTGESVPIEKSVGDWLIAGTLNESGTMKMRVMRSGKDSTLEQMAELIREAQKNKSRSERLADRFAEIFLPVVLVVGVVTYVLTRDILMTAALFLVACADDMAVAIPLAITASLGQAARRGVVVKGGEWLDNLGKIDTLVLDKTGTLTYGKFAFRDAVFLADVSPEAFWRAVGSAEKFSEHPAGNAIWKEAARRIKDIPDPIDLETHKGGGIRAKTADGEVTIGDEKLFIELGIAVSPDVSEKLRREIDNHAGTTVIVAFEKKIVGFLSIADVPRAEAKESIGRLKRLGVRDVVMFTGDNEIVAGGVAAELGIDSYKASMLPDKKLVEIESLETAGRCVAMVGDGVNDAPALSRADVGIAMGSGGTAVAVESADVVILTDNLARIPEMVTLGRRTASVIRWDSAIWVVTNILGFTLVFIRVLNPALAAFYNFATDFLPLLNSVRLFRKK